MNVAEPRTLLDVLEDVRGARRSIIAGAALGLIAAFLFLFLATPFYKAQMIVQPAAPMSGASEPLALRDGDAFPDPRPEASNIAGFTRFESMIAGPRVAEAMLKDEKILRGLSYDRLLRIARGETAWTPQHFADYIAQRVRVEQVGETPLRRLVYYHPNPEFSAYFLERLRQVTDRLIRSDMRDETQRRADYLRQAINVAGNPDNRRALTSLLMEQERMLMLAALDQPYAAAVVEPPSASFRPEWPVKSLVYAAFVIAGAVAGFVAYGLRRG